MANIVDLNQMRARRKGESRDLVLRELEKILYMELRQACHHNRDASAVLNNVIDDIESIEDEKLKQTIVSAIGGQYKHLLNHYTEIFPQLIEYLRTVKYHLHTGRHDIIAEPGLKYQGDDDVYPSPITMIGFGTDPHDDDSVFASAAINCRSIWFDGEFQDRDTPAIQCHPQTPPGDKETTHLTTPPKVGWKDGVDTRKRGMFSPYLFNRLLEEFFAAGIACNSGVGYKFVNGCHRYSYLQMVTLSSVVEWSLTIEDSIYTLP